MYKYEYSKLKELLLTQGGKDFYQKCLTCYNENYQGKTNSELTYYKYKEFYLNGNRTHHEAEAQNRRKRLMLLQVLALGDDKYLEDLEQVIFEICNQLTWVYPAHNLDRETLVYDCTVIDLAASETAFFLAETAFVFKDKLCPDILNRIRLSIKTKIVDNFESRTFFFDRSLSNWAAVCCCGVGLAYLYAFPERFESIKERIFTGFERYLSGIYDDGCCAEGYIYWIYGFGYFCTFFDVYTNLTGDYPQILNSQKVRDILEYGMVAKLSNKRVLPFADGGRLSELEPDMSICAIEQLFNVKINNTQDFTLPFARCVGFRALYSCALPLNSDVKQTKYKYYDKTQVYVNKKKNYSFAVKGGHNAERHNHNDIGTFYIVKDEKIIIADLGAGEYIKAYFSGPSEDYEGKYGEKIFVLSSLSHSVPIVNGDTQKPGLEYHGEVLESNEKEFSLDISKAYKQEIEKLNVKYTCEEDFVKVSYDVKGVEKVTFRFVSVIEPKIVEGGVLLDEVKLLSKANKTPIVQKKPFSAYGAVPECAYVIDFDFVGDSVNQEFIIDLK